MRKHVTSETVKASVTAWVSVAERTRSTLLGWIDAAAGVRRAYFEGGYKLGSRRTKSRTICRSKVFDLSCKRNCCLTKETGENDIDLIATESGRIRVPDRLKARTSHSILYQSLARGANRAFEMLEN
jgi:hypothetical protein